MGLENKIIEKRSEKLGWFGTEMRGLRGVHKRL